jgi:hypothetical protein
MNSGDRCSITAQISRNYRQLIRKLTWIAGLIWIFNLDRAGMESTAIVSWEHLSADQIYIPARLSMLCYQQPTALIK